MAKLTNLAAELLFHIHALSVEDASPSERQRARHRFALISRAFYLALADPTEFHIHGEKQARSFLLQLEQEKKLQVLRTSDLGNRARATTRSETRSLRVYNRAGVGNVRRRSLVANHERCDEIFERILREIGPDLVALDLDLDLLSQGSGGRDRESDLACLVSLEEVLGGIVGLRELRIASQLMCNPVMLRILLPLQSLQVLELPIKMHGLGDHYEESLHQLSFPNLRTLRVALCHHDLRLLGNSILRAVGTNLQVLDLADSAYFILSRQCVISLLPSVTNVVQLSWVARPEPLSRDSRDAVVGLLGAMKKLEVVAMSAWKLQSEVIIMKMQGAPLHDHPIDSKLFDTLATLPSLHTVELLLAGGKLDEDRLVEFIKDSVALCSLWILHETSRESLGWTQAERDRVQKAAMDAGVAFEYNTRYGRW